MGPGEKCLDSLQCGDDIGPSPPPELFLVLYAELFRLATVVSSELPQQASPFYSLLTPAQYTHGDVFSAADDMGDSCAPGPIQPPLAALAT